MFFNGDSTARKRVDLGGRSSKERDRQVLLEEARVERKRRLELRQQTSAAIKIQKCFRGRRVAELARSNVRKQFHLTFGDHCQNADTQCFSSDSEFLPQLLFFFTASNGNDVTILVEACRLLLYFVPLRGSIVDLFVDKDYIAKHSMVETRVKKLVYFCLKAVHHNRDLLKRQLLMPSKYSSMPTIILLETAATLMNPDLPWVCKVADHLLQRKVFFMLRGILLTGLHSAKTPEASADVSSFEHVLVLISSHTAQHSCNCSGIDLQWSFSLQLLSVPFLWRHLPYFKEVFFSKGLVRHYIHQMASCLPSHVNVLPDESHELPGYACLLGNLLEAAGVAMSEPNCCFVMAMDFVAVSTFLLEGLPSPPSAGENKTQVALGLDSATADRVSMADDKIERIVGGEDVGYVPDSDDENHEDEGISARSFTEVCSITCKTTDIKQESSFHNSDSRKNQGRAVDIRTKVVGMDKGQWPCLDVTRDQISLATEVGELALDQEAEFSLRCSENFYRDKTLSKVNRSRIRKLYNEVTSGAKEEPLCETGIYIGSQEPGELSQAIAMNVVDKLIPDNDEGSCQYIGPRKTMGSSSPPILIVKGAQHLAKWANRRSSVIESRTFDWVENLADDGKGNCFSERTEFFSESQGNPERSHKQTLKPAYSSGINTASVDMSRKKKSGSVSYPNTISLGPPWTPNLVPGISSTDELHKSETESNNLFAVADAQLLSEPPEQQVEVADVGVVEEIYDIGPNTQIAAEAMEALFHGSPVNYELDEITNPKNVNLVEDSYIGMPLNKTLVNHGSKRVTSTYALEGNLICYKRRKALSNKINKGSPSSFRNYSNNLRVKNKVDNMKERTKVMRAKWEHKAHLKRGCAANANELTVSSNADKESGPVDCKSSKEVDKSGISSNTQVSGTKRMVGNLPYVVPVAPRTRRSKYVKMSNWTRTFSDYGKAFSVPTETSNPGPKLEDEKCVTNTSRSRSSERKGVSEGLNQVSKLDNNASYTEVQVIDNQREANLKTSFFKTGAYIPANSRNLHPTTSGKSTIFAKPKNLSPSVNVHPASIVQPSTWCGESKAIVNIFHQILSTVKRKRRSDSRRISSVSSHSLKSSSEKDFKKCKTGFSEVGLTLPTRNISVISHIVSSIEVASLEMAAAPASDAQGTKVNAKAEIDPPIRKPRNTLKVSHSKHVSKSSIARELIRLEATEPAATWLLKDPRRRKDMSKVCVLFSNHLEDDVIKQQKKILARFKVPIASSAADATHFIADRFARTKNMLEAMAMGKPVVTHLWLDSCARTSYFIDERNYLLRDLKKEKEIGFSMHVSLARAHQHPLLQGKRVFITPNVKPDTEVVESLVKAAHGQIHPVVRGHGKVNDKIPDDLLVISCDEDYAACAYLLNKGVEVFSSDLILNGIIIQKLEFDRYQLFVNHVKRSS